MYIVRDGRRYVTAGMIWLPGSLLPHITQRLGSQANAFRGRLAITEQRIWLNQLPESFRGFRILQLSDIHHSLFVPREHVEAVVAVATRLKPDLVALTGDFVTYSRASIEPAG